MKVLSNYGCQQGFSWMASSKVTELKKSLDPTEITLVGLAPEQAGTGLSGD